MWEKAVGSLTTTRELDRLRLEQEAWVDVMKRVMDAPHATPRGEVVAEPDDEAARSAGMRAERKLASQICAVATGSGWSDCVACRSINRIDFLGAKPSGSLVPLQHLRAFVLYPLLE